MFYVNAWMVQLYPPGEHCARVAAAGVGQNARHEKFMENLLVIILSD
jgi:hypothetical protein